MRLQQVEKCDVLKLFKYNWFIPFQVLVKNPYQKKILCNAGKRHSPQTDKEGSAREYIETLTGLAIKTYKEGI